MNKIILGCVMIWIGLGCARTQPETNFLCNEMHGNLIRSMGEPDDKTFVRGDDHKIVYWWYDDFGTVIMFKDPVFMNSPSYNPMMDFATEEVKANAENHCVMTRLY